MPQITWRNVEAPNFNSAIDGYKAFSSLLSSGLGDLSQGLQNFQNQGIKNNDQAVLADALRYQDPATLRANLANGSIVGDRRLSANAIGALQGMAGGLIKDDAGQLENTKGVFNFDRFVRDSKANDALRPAAAALAAAPNAQARSAVMGAIQPLLAGARIEDTFGLLKAAQGAEAGQASNLTGTTQANAAARSDADQQQFQRAFMGITRKGGNLDATAALAELEGMAQRGEITPGAWAAAQQAFPGAYGGAGVGGVGAPGGTGSGAGAVTAALGGGNSRADRNANPGNLKAPEGTWVRSAPGFIGVDDQGFAKFDTPANGLVAMTTQLNRYREGTQATGGKPVTTVEGIVGTWSPQSDPNNAAGSTANYAKYVAGKLGLQPGDAVPADKMPAMAQAMYEFESGNRGAPGSFANASDPFTARADNAQLSAAAAKSATGSITEKTMQDNVGSIASKYLSAAAKIDSTPVSVAKELRSSDFGGTNQGFLVGKINQIMREGGVNAAVAGEVLRANIEQSDRNPLNPIPNLVRNFTPGSTVNLGGGIRLNDKGVKESIKSLKDPTFLKQAIANDQLQAKAKQIEDSKKLLDTAQANYDNLVVRARTQPGVQESLTRAATALTQAKSAFDASRASQMLDPGYNPERRQPVAKTVANEAEQMNKVMGAGAFSSW